MCTRERERGGERTACMLETILALCIDSERCYMTQRYGEIFSVYKVTCYAVVIFWEMEGRNIHITIFYSFEG